MNDTLIIIPAFNEEASIGATLEMLRREEPDRDVVVVDDGSVDRTREIVRAHGVTVLSLPYNLGIGGALRTGFRYGVRHGYQRAVQFDADGQHSAAHVERLLAELESGADLVIGSRFAPHEPGSKRRSEYQVGGTRGGAMALLRLLVRVLTGRRFTDTTSGFRAFSRPMLEFFSVHYPVEYMESLEALILAHGAGFDVREVPVEMTAREGGVASTRGVRLAYHFARVTVVALLSKGAMRRPGLPGAASSERRQR
jgi:glycosyltransferase involved in cell wall biosynthesis